MTRDEILKLLQMVSEGGQTPESALETLANLPSICMDYATLDTHRRLRRGIPETIYGQDKTPAQIEGIVEKLTEAGSPVLVTRLSPEAAKLVKDRWPEARTDEVSRTLAIGSLPRLEGPPVMVIAAGTSDLPVAEEAVKTANFLGRRFVRAYDVGVSGLHRLAAVRDDLEEAGVIIAVAGMEGALPSVVTGLVSVPVIGVPTSVGYGASLSGITPLLTMLSSCACGLTVVNIDNGYGAAVAAHMILGVGERGLKK